jgi:NADH dehydrogenase
LCRRAPGGAPDGDLRAEQYSGADERQTAEAYTYKDHGSLVSLSNYSTVGSLMGNLMRGSMMVEGRIARFVYISLYRMHQIALHGYFKTGLMMLVGRINRIIRPRLKLH